MKHIRGFLAILTVLMLFTPALFAGGSQEKAKAAGPVSMRFFWWGDESRHKATLASIEAYMKKTPNVKIEGEYMGWEGYFNKLVTQIAGGSAPDVIQSDYKFFPELVAQGDFFHDLSQLKAIDTSGFDKAFLEKWCIYNQKLLALPTGTNAQTAIINKTLMDKEGVNPNRLWTWDMIYEEGKKLHAKDAKYYFLVQGPENVVYQLLIPYVNQLTGGNIVNDDFTIGFDKPSMTKGLAFIKKLLDEGVLLPLEQSAMFGVNIPQNPKWVNGEAAMYLNFTTHLVVAKDAAKGQTIISSRLPVMDGAKQTGILVTPAQILSISKKTASVEEAAKFVNYFFNDKDSVMALGLVRSVPAASGARDMLAAAGKMDKDLAEAISVGLKNMGLPISQLTNHNEISKILRNAVELVGYKKATPEQATETAYKDIEATLADLKKAAKK